MRIKLIMEVADLEYGVGLALDTPLFRQGDGMLYRDTRFWCPQGGKGPARVGAWIRRDVRAQAFEQLVKNGVDRGMREVASRLQRLKPIAASLEKFAKQAGEEGHGALGFTMMCFSAALDQASQGLPVDLEALKSKVNSGTAEARRHHEISQQYTELAKTAVDADLLVSVASGLMEPVNAAKTPE